MNDNKEKFIHLGGVDALFRLISHRKYSIRQKILCIILHCLDWHLFDNPIYIETLMISIDSKSKIHQVTISIKV